MSWKNKPTKDIRWDAEARLRELEAEMKERERSLLLSTKSSNIKTHAEVTSFEVQY